MAIRSEMNMFRILAKTMRCCDIDQLTIDMNTLGRRMCACELADLFFVATRVVAAQSTSKVHRHCRTVFGDSGTEHFVLHDVELP